MALLPEAARARVWAHAMRAAGLGPLPGITKPDLRAAVEATDQWIEDNAASYNAALPQPFRSQASMVQKTLLFCYVAMRRAGILRTEED